MSHRIVVAYDGSAQAESAFEHALDPAARPREIAASRRVVLKAETAVGPPAEQIAAFARLMPGSVSERALRYAHCPVLAVR